jgi:hypothetical protein
MDLGNGPDFDTYFPAESTVGMGREATHFWVCFVYVGTWHLEWTIPHDGSGPGSCFGRGMALIPRDRSASSTPLIEILPVLDPASSSPSRTHLREAVHHQSSHV